MAGSSTAPSNGKNPRKSLANVGNATAVSWIVSTGWKRDRDIAD